MKKTVSFLAMLSFFILAITLGSCRKEKMVPEIGIDMKFVNYDLSTSSSFDIYKGIPANNNKVATLQANNDGTIFISKDFLSSTEPLFIVNSQLGVYEKLDISLYTFSQDNNNYFVYILFTHRNNLYTVDDNHTKLTIAVSK